MVTEQDKFTYYLNRLSAIGKALSTEKDQTRLLALIIRSAMDLTQSDGGTLYMTDETRQELQFKILHNDSLNIHIGGTTGNPVNFYPVRLYNEDGTPNDKMIAAHAAVSEETVNIPDVYSNTEFDFDGTRKIDKKNNYRTISCLAVPMVNHENEVIGVLQLINATDPDSGKIIPFNKLQQSVVESLSSQAAVSITNTALISAQKELFDSFIQLIANAIDEKSPYTAGHCRRVPVLTRMIAEAVNTTEEGALADFHMTEQEMYELDVAAWLHDCGKITTPEYVVDKATKLETIYDRVHVVAMRFVIAKLQAVISELLPKVNKQSLSELLAADDRLRTTWQQLDEDLSYVRTANISGESMTAEQEKRLHAIAKKYWQDSEDNSYPLLEEEELSNLLIARGTLNPEERQIINNHVTVTIKMLESLPYPKHLRRVPEYAGGHHEKIDGSGYPNGLLGSQMSLPARMLAVADIFEALTAADRPYKKAMPLSAALKIMKKLCSENHIDADLYDAFIRQKVYLRYAREYLPEVRLDDIPEAELSR